MKYGIIQGSGPNCLEKYTANKRSIETPYGRIVVHIANYRGMVIPYVSRHGIDHRYPPHQINYRGNIEALNLLGVRHIFATGLVSSCNEAYRPGDLVVLEDFMDFTRTRLLSFHQDGEAIGHVHMEEPYCPQMRSSLWQHANKKQVTLAGNGTYVCIEGPRYETQAEATFYQKMGWDVVGMTNVPEVVLAKEKGLCYSSVAIVRDWATGLGNKDHSENNERMLQQKKADLTELFLEIFREGSLSQNNCSCANALFCPK